MLQNSRSSPPEQNNINNNNILTRAVKIRCLNKTNSSTQNAINQCNQCSRADVFAGITFTMFAILIERVSMLTSGMQTHYSSS